MGTPGGGTMSTPGWTRGCDLSDAVRRDVLRRFVHRATVENFGALRRARAILGQAFDMPLVSDAEWLARTRFATKKDGTLDERTRHCETSW